MSPEARLRENQHCPRRMPDPQPRGLLGGIDPQPVVRADGYTVDHLCGAKLTPRALGRPKKGQRKNLPFSLQRTLRRVSFPHSFTRMCSHERDHTACRSHCFLSYFSHTCPPFDVDLVWVFPSSKNMEFYKIRNRPRIPFMVGGWRGRWHHLSF